MRLRRVWAAAWILLFCATAPVWGQQPQERTEPPRASRITLSPPNEAGEVQINGAENTVFPGAVVGIRNLYSGELEFTTASPRGTFSVTLPGVAGNPYLIQADNDYAPTNAQFPGGLPGDIGVIVRAPLPESGFEIAGLYGGARWTAEGSVSALDMEPESAFSLSLDVTLDAPDPFGAALSLQPVAVQDGEILQPVSAVGASGWSGETTPTGMAIDGLDTLIPLGEMTSAARPADAGGRTRFVLRHNGVLPEAAAPGLYVPLLILPEGGRVRLPLVLRIGPETRAVLPLALFMDESSDGARGLLPEDGPGALSHGARWNGPQFILPPGEYPLEPYLPTQLLNQSDSFAAPLIAFDFPGGMLSVTVESPNGEITELSGELTQNWIGTTAEDERARFGGGPVDTYRLTTGVPALAACDFSEYGAYTITLELTAQDVFGRSYTGGGTYTLWIAETLKLLPGLLSGAPVAEGEPVYAGVRILPPVPAEVSQLLEVAALDGTLSASEVAGQANSFGVFLPTSALQNEVPGEYRLDTIATYTDPGGRLWAGSLRSAGVITGANGPLIAHGARGVADQASGAAPARYSLRGLAAQLNDDSLLEGAVLHQPFYAGAVARIASGANYGLTFPLQLQDTVGDWAQTLIASGAATSQSAARGELPSLLPGASYAYISAVTPAVSVRQQVLGGLAGGLPASVTADDPLNQQIGAGAAGLAPGDWVFLFGGAVVRAPEAGVSTTAGYAALAEISAGGDPNTLGVLAPAQLGAAPLGFIPTGLAPGLRLTEGDPIVLAGHVAPPIPAVVSAKLTSPSGIVTTLRAQTDAFGYAFDPEAALTANEPGVWWVRLSAENEAGAAGVPGTDGEAFPLFVLPAGAGPLDWNRPVTDVTIPGATAYNLTLTASDEWNEVRGYVVISTPGRVLSSGEARLTGRSLSTQYNPAELRQLFAGFEVEGRTAGPHVSDIVTITAAMTGIDADGELHIQTRAFTFFHDRLMAFEYTESEP